MGRIHRCLAQVGQTNAQRGEVDRFWQTLQLDPQRPSIRAGGDAARGGGGADDNHRAGKLDVGHRLQHLDTVAVCKHQIHRNAVEP